MRQLTTRNCKRVHGARVLILLVAALVATCDGDSRPFEEAVEVQALDLTSVAISRPFIEQQADYVINPEQSAQLGLTGMTSSQAAVTISTNDRQWSSTNPAVVSVNDNGVITGGSDGVADILLTIGGIESGALPVTVRNQTLESIELIQPVTSATLERCLPGEFFAVGRFVDADQTQTQTQTLRPLFNASFSVDAASEAVVEATDRSTVTVNATSLNAVGLTVAAQGVDGFTGQLTVLNTLLSIATLPNPAAVDVNDTLAFTATGTYTADEIAPEEPLVGEPVPLPPVGGREENITENVVWEVISGTDNASVSNEIGSRGQLTGSSAGTATLEASCGATAIEQSVTINAVVSSSTDDLSFNEDSQEIDVGEQLFLEVSLGSSFDEDDVIDNDDIQFSITNLGNTATPITVTTFGVVTGNIPGGIAQVTATFVDEDDLDVVLEESITIEVSDF